MKSLILLIFAFLACSKDPQVLAVNKPAVAIKPDIKLDGRYSINLLITDAPANEYILQFVPAGGNFYGNSAVFKSDGTFTTSYSADCGNDCFTLSEGRYIWADATHIRFIVERVKVTGDCNHKDYAPKKDLGLYAVRAESNKVILAMSNGNAAKDRKILSWSKKIDEFDKETYNIYNFYPIPLRPAGINSTDAHMVAVALKGNSAFNIDDVRVLYSKILRSYFKAILFEHKGQQHIVLCTMHSGYVGLYDPEKWPKEK